MMSLLIPLGLLGVGWVVDRFKGHGVVVLAVGVELVGVV